jgi:hypothetical protein
MESKEEGKEESKEESKEETRVRGEHTNDFNQQKRRAKFPNGNFKGGSRMHKYKYKGNLRR